MTNAVNVALGTAILIVAALTISEGADVKYRFTQYEHGTGGCKGVPKTEVLTDLWVCAYPCVDDQTSCVISPVVEGIYRLNLKYNHDCRDGSGSTGNLTLGECQWGDTMLEAVPLDAVSVKFWPTTMCGHGKPPAAQKLMLPKTCVEVDFKTSVMVVPRPDGHSYDYYKWNRDYDHVCSGAPDYTGLPWIGPCIDFNDGTSIMMKI